MPYTKSDMLYTDYIWTTRYSTDDPKVTGEPDSTLLARTEGWEMLYFINKLADKWDWSKDNLASRRKLEKTIRTKVPSDIRSQEKIKVWIEQNFTSFWGTL